jgi:4-nitrophenyl phosphatase
MNYSPSFNIRIIRSLILDMDGVLWRGSTPIGDLSEIFSKIRTKGLNFIMVTNNASRSPDQYVKKLAKFGVKVEDWQVINSGIATADYMKKRFPAGGEIFTIGDESLQKTFQEAGFHQGGNNPLAVVAALDRDLTYKKLSEATLLIRRGIPFIGTNPDLSFPIPAGQAPGAGAILAALEAASGVKPTIIGKPEPKMYQVALDLLGSSSEETLVVGDRLETDILGAQRIGCPSALVLTGVTSTQEAKDWNPAPEIIIQDLKSLIDYLPGGKS